MLGVTIFIIGTLLILTGGIAVAKISDQTSRDKARKTYRVAFPAGLDPDRVTAWLRTLSGTLRPGPGRKFQGVPSVVFELWATPQGIVHYLKVPWAYEPLIRPKLEALVPGVRLIAEDEHPVRSWVHAVEAGLKATSRQLHIHEASDLSTSILSNFGTLEDGETLICQWVIAPAVPEHKPIVKQTSTREMSISSLWRGIDATKDEVEDRRTKLDEANMLAVLRVGAVASSRVRAQFMVRGVMASLDSSRGPSTYFYKRLTTRAGLQVHIDRATAPLQFPAVLSVSELTAVIGWPLNDPMVPGLPAGVSRYLPAPAVVPTGGRVLGRSNYPGRERNVAQPYSEAVKHTHIMGGTGCLHPDTPIYDPYDRTTLTVKQRYQLGEPFHVYAKRDTRLVVAPASPPVVFRRADMYRLYNEQHEIFVTGEHRVWNGQAYVEVGTLYQKQGDAGVLLPSISESDLSRLNASGLRCWQIPEGSQDGHHPSRHLCDPQLPSAPNNGRASAPSPGGAVEPCSNDCSAGDQAHIQAHSHHGQCAGRCARSSSCLHVTPHSAEFRQRVLDTLPLPFPSPPSSVGSGADSFRSDRVGDIHLFDLGSIAWLLARGGALCWPSSSGNGWSDLPPRLSELFPGCTCLRVPSAESPTSLPHLEPSCGPLFTEYFKNNTFRVEEASTETYYDFHVPEVENYLAGGVINHNSGKTTLMANMAKQDIDNDFGVMLMESKGDLFQKVLEYVPPRRINDVVVLDLTDKSFPVGFNLLQQGDPAVVATELIGVFDRLFSDTSRSLWMHELMTYAIPTLMLDPESTIMDLPALVSPSPEERIWRDELIRKVRDPFAKAYWTRTDNQYQSRQDQKADPLLTRFHPLTDPVIRNIIGQSKSSFYMDDVVKQNKILLVNLSGVDKTAASVMGTLLMNSLWNSVQRWHSQKGIHLYLDEFHRFMNIPVDTESMLVEARSMGLGMVLAHQQLAQLKDESLKQAIMTNARTKLLFNLSAKDARTMADEFGGGVAASDISNLGAYEMVARVMTPGGVSAPFTLNTLEAASTYGKSNQVRYVSRQQYGRPVSEVQDDMLGRRNVQDTRKPKPPPKAEGWGSLG